MQAQNAEMDAIRKAIELLGKDYFVFTFFNIFSLPVSVAGLEP
jgi:hypothetical protein